MPKKIDDGLNKFERYRLKDIEGYRKRKREWAKTAEQRKKRTEYMRKWREKNREKHNEQARLSHHRNKHKYVNARRDSHLRRSFGITLKEKEAMLANQGGICLICSRELDISSRVTHVDHDHETGQIRGILCSMCNTKLGWYETNKESINKYLN